MKNTLITFSFIISLIILGTAENSFAQRQLGGNRQKPAPSGQRTAPTQGTTPPTTSQPQGTAPTTTRQLPGRLSGAKTGGSEIGETTSDSKLQNRSKPQPTETQQQNIQKLEDDLLAIKANSQVTQEQKDDLANSLYALADGATKPDKEAVDKLATDLSSALVDGNFSNQEKAQLASDLETVMNSANIPAEEVEAAINSITSILKASNIDQSDIATIKTDLQNIGTERKANRGSRIPKKTT